MKIRTFMDMVDGIYRVIVNTEDWSQGDIMLMGQFGEPEVDVGGEIRYISTSQDSSSSSESSGGDHIKIKVFGDILVRVLHSFPFCMSFDSRDYGTLDDAVSAGNAWRDAVTVRIQDAVRGLREKSAPLPNEMVSEI